MIFVGNLREISEEFIKETWEQNEKIVSVFLKTSLEEFLKGYVEDLPNESTEELPKKSSP